MYVFQIPVKHCGESLIPDTIRIIGQNHKTKALQLQSEMQGDGSFLGGTRVCKNSV